MFINGYKVAFVGGGSAGHVVPCLTVIEALHAESFETMYLGRAGSIEQELVKQANVAFFPIRARGLRRYLSATNFGIPVVVVRGIQDAYRILQREKPDILFSKGGFVALPAVIAAHRLKIPVIIHESDSSLGLANTLSAPMAHTICVSSQLPDNVQWFWRKKTIFTGNPVRYELKNADASRAVSQFNVNPGRTNILVFGGSLGAARINEAIRASIPVLAENIEVHHVCGKGNRTTSVQSPRYHQYEYISDGFCDLMKAADLVICRAGANTITEVMYLKKPMILIPLPDSSSRGDQVANAEELQQKGAAIVLDNDTLTSDTMVDSIHVALQNQTELVARMNEMPVVDGTEAIVSTIQDVALSLGKKHKGYPGKRVIEWGGKEFYSLDEIDFDDLIQLLEDWRDDRVCCGYVTDTAEEVLFASEREEAPDLPMTEPRAIIFEIFSHLFMMFGPPYMKADIPAFIDVINLARTAPEEAFEKLDQYLWSIDYDSRKKMVSDSMKAGKGWPE